MDDITIGVTENVNNISVTAQPNDQIIDIAVTETVETVLLDVSTTVQEVSVTATQNVIVENITVDYVSNENHIDINVTDATQDVTLNVTPTLIEINILRSGGEVNILQFDSLADFPATGSSDYFYLAKDTNKLYRWTGSAYAEISATANAVWGQIIGTLSEQTDLQNALNLKAPINSPTFTGTVSGITKAMVGLGQVDNTSDLDKPISTATQTALNAKQPLDADLTSIAALSGTFGLLKKTANNSYTIDTNTYLTEITSTDVTDALGFTPENAANKGVNNGYASLDGGGKVPSSQLPSYVDDVIEVANYASLPTTGETGKIYITLDTNKIYRWTGSVYVEVSSSAAVWGGITGTLSNQTDLQTALDAKQDDLNGTGFVKASGTTISYDNTVYYPDSNPDGYTSNLGTVTSVALTVPSAFSVSGSPITSSGTLAITGAGTTAQYVRGDGTLATMPDISGFVPYTGATANVDLGTHTIIAAKGTFSSSGSGDTVGITHSSGSGIALNISKAGNGEGIYVNKTSGSGNAVTIIGTLNATTLVKSGGTSTQFLKADGSVDSSTYLTSASLSGYVATTGDQTIAGLKTFSGFALFDHNIFIKQGTDTSFLSGYNVIDATSSSIFLGLPNTYGANLVLSSLTDQRNFTFPDAAGTIALTSDIPSLAGYVATTGDQSISGVKTFTTAVHSSILKFSESGGFNQTPGYTQIGGTADYFTFANGGNTKSAQFTYGTGTVFNLPSASGTLALTSDLHNAVTIGTANGLSLSTQVLSLALASTSTTGALSSTDWNTFNGKQNALTNPVTGTGTTSYLPKFTGTSAIGNSLLYDTGSVLLVGATSASDGQSKLELVSASTVGLKIISSGANGNNTFLSIQASKEWRFVTNRGDLISGNQGDLIIRNNTDGINHIILNQGGSTTFAGALSGTSATFSSTLTTPFLSVNQSGGQIGSFRSTNTNGGYITWESTSSTLADIGTLQQIFGTGGSDTFGINARGARSLAFGTNNTERFRINSDGNVGIGTTSPNGKLTSYGNEIGLQLTFTKDAPSGAYGRLGQDSNGTFLTQNAKYDGSSWTRDNTGGVPMALALHNGNGRYEFRIAANGTNPISWTNALVIESNAAATFASSVTAGDILTINGSSSGKLLKLNSKDNLGDNYIEFNQNDGTRQGYIGYGYSAYNYMELYQSANEPILMSTNGSERMRITSGGKLLVGTTTAGYGLFSEQRVTINPTNDGIVVAPLPQNYSAYTVQGNNDTGTRYAMYIANGSGTAVGNISFTSTVTLFNSLSDYRLKEDLKPINGLEIVNKINVYDYKWKLNDTRMDGVLAHELAEVLPYAVSGIKDGEQMQTVDYSKIVPVMVQAIKELKAKIETLENK